MIETTRPEPGEAGSHDYTVTIGADEAIVLGVDHLTPDERETLALEVRGQVRAALRRMAADLAERGRALAKQLEGTTTGESPATRDRPICGATGPDDACCLLDPGHHPDGPVIHRDGLAEWSDEDDVDGDRQNGSEPAGPASPPQESSPPAPTSSPDDDDTLPRDRDADDQGPGGDGVGIDVPRRVDAPPAIEDRHPDDLAVIEAINAAGGAAPKADIRYAAELTPTRTKLVLERLERDGLIRDTGTLARGRRGGRPSPVYGTTDAAGPAGDDVGLPGIGGALEVTVDGDAATATADAAAIVPSGVGAKVASEFGLHPDERLDDVLRAALKDCDTRAEAMVIRSCREETRSRTDLVAVDGHQPADVDALIDRGVLERCPGPARNRLQLAIRYRT